MFGPLLIEALRAPLRDPQWVRKVAVGGLLNAGLMAMFVYPVFLVVGMAVVLLLMGYFYRVFVDGLNGATGQLLPDWGGWRSYLFAGLSLFLIAVGYILIAAVGLTALMSGTGLTPSAEDPQKMSRLLMLMMVTSLFLYSFLPIAFARYAAEGRAWAAFDPSALWSDIRRVVRGNYIQACLSFYGLSLMGNLLLGGLPVVGLPLVGVFLFYLMVVFANVFGRMIGEAGKGNVQPAA